MVGWLVGWWGWIDEAGVVAHYNIYSFLRSMATLAIPSFNNLVHPKVLSKKPLIPPPPLPYQPPHLSLITCKSRRLVGCQGLLEEIPSRMIVPRKENLVMLPSSEPRGPSSKSNRHNKNKYAIKEDLSSECGCLGRCLCVWVGVCVWVGFCVCDLKCG